MTAVCLRIVEVVIAAAEIEDAARRRQRAFRDVGEEVAFAAQVGLLDRIVREIAEVLRAVVVADVADVRGDAGRVRRLEVVAVLVPAPVRPAPSPRRGDDGDVLLDVGEVEIRIAVLGREPVDPAAHHRQRQRGEGEVRGDVVRIPVFVRRGRLADCGGRTVEFGAPPGLRVVDQRRALGRRRLPE